jgi:hypothetical protein
MSHQQHVEKAKATARCEWCGEALDTEPDRRRQYHRLCFVEFSQVAMQHQLGTLADQVGRTLQLLNGVIDRLPRLP